MMDYLDSIYFSKVGVISVYTILRNYTLCLIKGYQTKEHNN